MAIIRLGKRRLAKPWGRHILPAEFDDAMNCEEPIGEVWFESPHARHEDLLIKYLFTSENLSVQVHPTDRYAQKQGLPYGKDEAWVVIDAEPRSALALGTRRVMTREKLRQSALDGTIENHLFWRPVRTGDAFYLPAGTIHAIGAGLTLVEVQTNVDATYRLWDYGRGRALQLDDAIAVANPVPYVTSQVPEPLFPGRDILCAGPKFILERWTFRGGGVLNPSAAGSKIWVIPLKAGVGLAGEALDPGNVWIVDEAAEMHFSDTSETLIAYPGGEISAPLWQAA